GGDALRRLCLAAGQSDPGGEHPWLALLRADARRVRRWIFFEGNPRDAGVLGRGDRTASRFGCLQVLDHWVPLVQRDWLRRSDRAGARIQRATSTRCGGVIETVTPSTKEVPCRAASSPLERRWAPRHSRRWPAAEGFSSALVASPAYTPRGYIFEQKSETPVTSRKSRKGAKRRQN